MKKRAIFIFSLFVILIFFILLYSVFFDFSVRKCNDGTLYNQCSKIQPYSCLTGELVENATLCGCSNVSSIDGDKCVSEYAVGKKTIKLNYVLRGKEGQITFFTYKILYDYLGKIPRFIDSDENFTLLDFRMKMLDNEHQRELLLPLVVEIQKITPNKEDQARIAISIVQNIPFGSSDKVARIGGITSEYQRYPYEVLYDNEGICGEKSELLVFLLRELGYGSSFLYYSKENHEAVGIKCPEKYAVDDSEFCFVETTGPSIISDDKTEYIGIAELKSFPKILIASDGLALSEKAYEYNDARILISIRESANDDGIINFIQYLQFKILREKYGLVLFD
jgi:hypothetical protein